MEQLNYQAQQFENIVPVLDVGDPSASLTESYKTSLTDQNSILTQMTRNATIEADNVKKNVEGLQALAKFSQTAVKEVTRMKNEQVKKEASEIWADAFNNFEEPSAKEIKPYEQQEKAANETDTDIDVALSKNLQKKQEKGTLTPTDSADAAKVRQATGWRGVVAANARAEAATQSYGPALSTFIDRENQKRIKAGEETIKPGTEYNRYKRDFDLKWSEQTGMSMANAGYTAKHVYPTLRREAASQSDTYTRQFNRQQAAITTEKDLQRLKDGEIDIATFFVTQKGLTTGDGKTLKSNEDVWATLASAKFSPEKLEELGRQGNPVTNKPYFDHPRFQTLYTDARKRRHENYTLGRAELNKSSRQGYEGIDNLGDAQAEFNRQLAAGIPRDIAMSNYNNAVSSTTRKLKVQSETLRIKELLDTRGPDYKLTAADLNGVPYEVWATFQNRLADDANSESTQARIRDSATFKEMNKNVDNIIKGVNPNVALTNQALGTRGAINEGTYKLQVMEEIALKAQVKLLAGDITIDQALEEARNEWVDEKKKLDPNEFWDAEKNMFAGEATKVNRGLQQAAAMQVRLLESTTIRDLQKGLQDSDYLPSTGGMYSERVQFLGRQFGKTPEEIVRMAREQKGLPPLEATERELALSEVPPAQRARIASLGQATPIQMAIRGQITSGQTLQGSAKQRTIAVGQQLLAMGYGGIWQHPDFHYDTGYAPGSGRADIGGHTPGGFHDFDEALDIGVQANGPAKLEQLYQYLNKNRERFGIAELFYDPDGKRGHPKGHHAHVHVSFGGADEGKL